MPRAGLDPEAVVEAAAQLADAGGLAQLTLAALAARLGVRTPSLYGHVGGLEDLRARLALRAMREIASDLSRAVAGRAGPEALYALADAYRAYALAHPGLYAAVQRAPGQDTAAGQAAADVIEPIAAVLRGYGLEGEETIHATRIVRSTLHGFVSLEADGGFAIPVSLDATWQRLVATLDRGLRSAGATLAP